MTRIQTLIHHHYLDGDIKHVLKGWNKLKKKKKSFDTRKKLNQSKILEVKEKIKSGKTEELEKELAKLEVECKAIAKEEEDMKKKEKKTPWNVDTISKPGFQKTVINKKPEKKDESQMSEEEREKSMKAFIKQNEKLMERYGVLKKYDDSKKFLLEHHNLVCEDTANYLVIWCINLEMEEKHELMVHVAHQCICMQYILELGKQLDVDPRACIGSFFEKIQNCVPEYREQFEKEISDFIKRIENRAKEKIQEAIKEQEEEEKQARLGPGGLDPIEVLESLPEELKSCFESRDIKLLQDTIAKMPEQEAVYHMKRCVDSGLWIPDGGLKLDGKTKTENTENIEEKEEEVEAEEKKEES